MSEPSPQQVRFLKLEDVAEELGVTMSQTYALVRSGDLPAIKIGGRGQWRIERSKLEEWIEAAYQQTRDFVREHPLSGQTTPLEDDSTDRP